MDAASLIASSNDLNCEHISVPQHNSSQLYPESLDFCVRRLNMSDAQQPRLSYLRYLGTLNNFYIWNHHWLLAKENIARVKFETIHAPQLKILEHCSRILQHISQYGLVTQANHFILTCYCESHHTRGGESSQLTWSIRKGPNPWKVAIILEELGLPYGA